MFKFRFNKKTDWDLLELTDEQLSKVPLDELQRIRDKRWAHGLEALQKRAEEELKRRDPRLNWKCLRCNSEHYHQKEIRVAGSFATSIWGWETNKYHAITCNYCGNTEFYGVKMSSGELGLGFFGN